MCDVQTNRSHSRVLTVSGPLWGWDPSQTAHAPGTPCVGRFPAGRAGSQCGWPERRLGCKLGTEVCPGGSCRAPSGVTVRHTHGSFHNGNVSSCSSKLGGHILVLSRAQGPGQSTAFCICPFVSRNPSVLLTAPVSGETGSSPRRGRGSQAPPSSDTRVSSPAKDKSQP